MQKFHWPVFIYLETVLLKDIQSSWATSVLGTSVCMPLDLPLVPQRTFRKCTDVKFVLFCFVSFQKKKKKAQY